VRAYSHHGHGPRAEQQARYKSATSDSTPHLRRAAGPYNRGNTELPLTAAWTSAHAPKLPWTVGRRIGRAGGHRTLNRSMPEEKAQGVSGML
jgi:hypothetical protein